MNRLKLLAACMVAVPGSLASQEKRDTVRVPDIPGYHTLAGDFHLHTVFSDGSVWPSFRVYEAKRDGLDFIALTDHLDYQGNPADVPADYDKPYDLAVEAARGSRLIVLKGGEISPRTPPYHLNALFLRDASEIPVPYMKDTKKRFVMKDHPTHDDLMAPFIAAKAQGAFITYNHPGYLYDWNEKSMGVNLMTPFHRELLERGMLNGIEIVNGDRYYKKAHKLAMEHNLTLIAGSDEHADVAATYRDTHRPVTLVFTKDSTAAGIREALDARRTVVYSGEYLMGRGRELEPLFKSSLVITTDRGRHNVEPLLLIRIFNRSAIPFSIRATSTYDFDSLPLGRTVLAPHATTTIVLRTLWETPAEIPVRVTVENMLSGPDTPFETTLTIRPSRQ